MPSAACIKRARRNAPWFALVLAALFFLPTLTTSKWLIGSASDFPLMHYPERAFTFECLRQGIVPLWNPRIFSGIPWQTGVRPVHYPGNLLGVVLPLQWEVKLTLVLHMALALWGMWTLARSLRLSPAAAWLAALVFACSSRFSVHTFAGHMDVCTTLAWMPWVVWACRGLLARPGPRALLGLALLAGLQLACGHLQIVYLTAWTVLGMLLSGMLPGSRKRGLVLLAGAGLGIALLTAFQLAPTLSNVSASNRFDRGVQFAGSQGPRAAALVSLVLPHLYELSDANSWTRWPGWEGNYYIGVVPVLLALLSARFRSGWENSWVVVILAVVLSFGVHTPLFALYLKLDPIAGQFRAPGRFAIPMLLLLSLHAGAGLDLVRRLPNARRLLLQMLALSLALLLTWWGFVQAPPQPGLLRLMHRIASQDRWSMLETARSAGPIFQVASGWALWAASICLLGLVAASRRPGLAVGLLLVIVGLDYSVNGRPYQVCRDRSALFPHLEVAREVAARAGLERVRTPENMINLSQLCGYDDVGGYSTFLDDDYVRANLLQLGLPAGTFTAVFHGGERAGLCSLLSGKLLVRSTRTPEPDCPDVAQAHGFQLAENPDALPRFYLAHSVAFSQDPQNSHREALHDWRRRRAAPLLDLAPAERGELAALPADQGPVDAVRDGWVSIQRAGCRVVSERPGLLVMTDSPARGWRAYLDGRAVPLLAANGRLHRALYVPAGEHRIEFRYFPTPLLWGLILSGLGWTGLAIWAWRRP